MTQIIGDLGRRAHRCVARMLVEVDDERTVEVRAVVRFRSDLGLFVHLHCLVSDGCFEEGHDGERPRFLAVDGLDERHLLGVLAAVRGDLADALDDEGAEPDEGLRACLDLSARASARTLRARSRRETLRGSRLPLKPR